MTSEFQIPAPLQRLMESCTPGDVSADHIRSVMLRYGERMSAGDVDGIAALFAPDCSFNDPINAQPTLGAENVRAFFQAVFDAQGGFVEMKAVAEPRIAANYGACPYDAVMTIDGEHVLVETLDVMHFRADGLVQSMDAYWGPSNIKPSARAPQRFAG